MPQGQYTVSSQTTSPPIPINLRKFNNGVGVLVGLTTGANLTYTVELTADDLAGKDYSPATGRWVPYDAMTAKTGPTMANLGFPVTALRLNVTAWTSGSATLGVVQADD
jgi:hypothetical protein